MHFPCIDGVRMLPLVPHTLAQKCHYAVFVHKTDFFIDKRLLQSFFMIKLSVVML